MKLYYCRRCAAWAAKGEILCKACKEELSLVDLQALEEALKKLLNNPKQ